MSEPPSHGETAPAQASSKGTGCLLVILLWPLLGWVGIRLLDWGLVFEDSGGCGDPYTFCPSFGHEVTTVVVALPVALLIASAISPVVAAPNRVSPESRRARWIASGLLTLGWLIVFGSIALASRSQAVSDEPVRDFYEMAYKRFEAEYTAAVDSWWIGEVERITGRGELRVATGIPDLPYWLGALPDLAQFQVSAGGQAVDPAGTWVLRAVWLESTTPWNRERNQLEAWEEAFVSFRTERRLVDWDGYAAIGEDWPLARLGWEFLDLRPEGGSGLPEVVALRSNPSFVEQVLFVWAEGESPSGIEILKRLAGLEAFRQLISFGRTRVGCGDLQLPVIGHQPDWRDAPMMDCPGGPFTTHPLATTTSVTVSDSTRAIALLEVGDCYNDPWDREDISDVFVVDCMSPHEHQLYFRFEFDEGPYPGATEVMSLAHERCLSAFAAFVGVPYEGSTLDIVAMAVTEESWSAEFRVGLCSVFARNDSYVTGSAQGSGR